MSGVAKAVGKVFKKPSKVLTGATGSILRSDAFKYAAIAAVIYFSAGAASGMYATPAAGTAGVGTSGGFAAANVAGAGGTMTATSTATGAGLTGLQAKASYMAATDAIAAEAVTAGATQSAAIANGMQAVAPQVASGELTAGQAVADASWGTQLVTPPAAGGTSGGFAAANTAAPAAAPATAPYAGITPNVMDTPPGQLGVGSMGPPPPAKTGMMAWLADNPMATMILGQGVMGAASGYAADKQATKRQDMYEDRLKDRGLYGYDYGGEYAGNEGVVASQRPTVAAAVAGPETPTVETPTVAPQTPASTPVPKEQLPQLLEKGQLA